MTEQDFKNAIGILGFHYNHALDLIGVIGYVQPTKKIFMEIAYHPLEIRIQSKSVYLVDTEYKSAYNLLHKLMQ